MNKLAPALAGLFLLLAAGGVGYLLLGEEQASTGLPPKQKRRLPEQPTRPEGEGLGAEKPIQGGPKQAGKRSVGAPVEAPEQGAEGAASTSAATARVSEEAASSADELLIEVVDAHGLPIGGASVIPRTQARKLPAGRTDISGLYRITELAKGDEIVAQVFHPRFSTPRVIGPVKAGRRVRLRFPGEEAGRLGGTILTGGGAPALGAILHVETPRGIAHELAGPFIKLDAQGRFDVSLAPGRYALWADAPGFAASDRRFVNIGLGASGAAQAELVLFAQASFGGRIDEILDLGSEVVAEMIISSGSEENPFNRSLRRVVISQAGNTFEVPGLAPGRYKVRITLANKNNLGSPWQSFELSPGGRHDFVASLHQLKLSVKGSIEAADGGPVRGADVSCETVYSKSDEHGNFALYGLPEGFSMIKFTKPGFAEHSRNIAISKKAKSLKVFLAQYGSVEGRVVDSTGQPAAQLKIVLVYKEQGDEVQLLPGHTDAEGRYHYDQVIPGSYYIKTGKGDPFDAKGAPSFNVRPGQLTQVPDLLPE